jgi:hypothetical protein
VDLVVPDTETSPVASTAIVWPWSDPAPVAAALLRRNIGHNGDAFGTSLPEDQKSALLEYLKKL